MMQTDLDYDSIAKAGSMLGSGAVIVMDETTCMGARPGAAVVFLFRGVLRAVHALPRGHRLDVRMVHRIEHGKGRQEDLDCSPTWPTTSPTHHLRPRGCGALPVKSFINHFRDEFQYPHRSQALPGERARRLLHRGGRRREGCLRTPCPK